MPTEEQRVDFPELRLLGQGKWPPSWRMQKELDAIQTHLKEGNAGLWRSAIFSNCISRMENCTFLVLKGNDIYFLLSRW